MNIEMKVITKSSNLNIRSGPAMSFDIVGSLKKDDTVIVTKMENGWGYHSKGWSILKYLENISDVISDDLTGVNLNDISPPKNISMNMDDDFISSSEIEKEGIYGPKKVDDIHTSDGSGMGDSNGGYNEESYVSNNNSAIPTLTELKNIVNMPHQYMPHVDNRIGDSFYGRKFMETIIADLPLVNIKPCIPEFLPTVKKKEKENVLKAIADKVPISDLITDPSSDVKYYQAKEAYNDYMYHVNGLLSQCASYLGLKDYIYKDWNIDQMDLSDIAKEMTGSNRNVTFYVDGSTGISESASNETSESMLSSGMKTVSDLGKEATFTMGAGAGMAIDQASLDNYNEIVGSSIAKNIKDPNSIMGRLDNVWSTFKSGGNMIFPEIYRDSRFNPSINISMKLRATYGTPECIFNQILKPFMHCVGLVMPRGLTANSYVYPYLVRAYCRGRFACEMGIVDSLSWKKGGNGDEWSVDGLPTSMDIEMSVRNLYPTMFINKQNHVMAFFANTQLLDFLAINTGIDLTEGSNGRDIEAAIQAFINHGSTIPRRTGRIVSDYLYDMKTRYRFTGRY